MNATKAIKLYCADCAGESSKEVTLCVGFDCPLWPFRTGSRVGSGVYKRRMEAAARNYAEDIAQMTRDGYETGRFSPSYSLKMLTTARKSRNTGKDT